MILTINLKQTENMIRFKLKVCSDLPFNRSEHMKQLHKEGRYIGTSKIGLWNISDEKRERMKHIRERNLLDKNARGYGSEYAMRVNNRILLHNKFQGEDGFLYMLDFPGSIKVGFSKDWERRTQKQIIGGKVILIISGPTNDLADLEFDTFVKFQKYTKLDENGIRYTEFLDRRVRRDVYKFLIERVNENKNLKFEVKNFI